MEKVMNNQFEPKTLRTTDSGYALEYVEGQGLRIYVKDQWHWAKAKACFPWSHPEEFIAVVNFEGEELHVFESLERCSDSDRQSLTRSLAESNFCFEITKISNIQERLDLREWNVDTASGPRVFHTKTSHWPTVLDNGQVFVRDLYGDVYRVVAPDQLDEESQNHLSALADF